MYLLLIVNVYLISNLFEKFLHYIQRQTERNLMNIDTKKEQREKFKKIY